MQRKEGAHFASWDQGGLHGKDESKLGFEGGMAGRETRHLAHLGTCKQLSGPWVL